MSFSHTVTNAFDKPQLRWTTRATMRAVLCIVCWWRAAERAVKWFSRLLFGEKTAESFSGWIGIAPHAAPDEPDGQFGPILDRSDAPRLFALLRQMADASGADLPAEVRLSHLPACGVLETPAAGPGGRHVLILGLPCLHVWTVGELSAVLAHEMVHVVEQDMRFARTVDQFVRELRGPTMRQVGWCRLWNPCHWAKRVLARVVAYVGASVSRNMEYRADAWAAELFGPAALVGAIEKLAVLDPAFRHAVVHYDARSCGHGNIYSSFATYWRRMPAHTYDRLRRRIIAAARPDRLHPSLTQRIDRLRRIKGNRNGPTAAGADREGATTHRARELGRSARGLLDNPQQFDEVLHNHLFDSRDASASVFHRLSC